MGPTAAAHRRLWLRLCLCLLVVAATGCSREPASNGGASGVVAWRPVGSWSGSASVQTETFTSETGSFRVHWQTNPIASSTDGSLHVVFRSADSGNPIIDAVNQRGAGEGVASVSAERPRWYYLGIEATDLTWTIRVEEPVFGRSASGDR